MNYTHDIEIIRVFLQSMYPLSLLFLSFVYLENRGGFYCSPSGEGGGELKIKCITHTLCFHIQNI